MRSARKPRSPVKNSSIGAKKRNRRNAIALPTSVPAESRSRCQTADADVHEADGPCTCRRSPRPAPGPIRSGAAPTRVRTRSGTGFRRAPRSLPAAAPVPLTRTPVAQPSSWHLWWTDAVAHDWREAGSAWGHAANDWSCFWEHYSTPSVVAIFQRLGVGPGVRLLDVACGSGGVRVLAESTGAEVAGIDAAEDLIDVAQLRNPNADIRLGSMFELPWADESFDVVISINGIWGGNQAALDEAHRVLEARRWHRHQLLGHWSAARPPTGVQGVRQPLARGPRRRDARHRTTSRSKASPSGCSPKPGSSTSSEAAASRCSSGPIPTRRGGRCRASGRSSPRSSTRITRC